MMIITYFKYYFKIRLTYTNGVKAEVHEVVSELGWRRFLRDEGHDFDEVVLIEAKVLERYGI